MKKKIIIANWKMNPLAVKEATMLLNFVSQAVDKIKNFKKEADLIICPPFIYLSDLKTKKLKNIKLGAQNCFWEDKGAYTGEISPLMLKNLGVEYVIIGHSERRNHIRESDEMIAQKVKAVFENKLIPILCVGETFAQRGKGIQKNIVQEQLKKNLKEIKDLKNRTLIIAYEPVWAIGTGNYCQPEEALEMIKFIKEIIDLNFGLSALETRSDSEKNLKILYGGSVDSKNVASYIKYPEIDGALVGGASIKTSEFQKLINEVSKTVETSAAQK